MKELLLAQTLAFLKSKIFYMPKKMYNTGGKELTKKHNRFHLRRLKKLLCSLMVWQQGELTVAGVS